MRKLGLAKKLEFSKQVVVHGSCSHTLVNCNWHTMLVVREGGENMLFHGKNDGVSCD
jgi:hypothetical protein